MSARSIGGSLRRAVTTIGSSRGGTGLLIATGVLTGFVFYFLSDVVLALGLSGKIPPALAAWTPAGICSLLGIGLLFHLEDG